MSNSYQMYTNTRRTRITKRCFPNDAIFSLYVVADATPKRQRAKKYVFRCYQATHTMISIWSNDIRIANIIGETNGLTRIRRRQAESLKLGVINNVNGDKCYSNNWYGIDNGHHSPTSKWSQFNKLRSRTFHASQIWFHTDSHCLPLPVRFDSSYYYRCMLSSCVSVCDWWLSTLIRELRLVLHIRSFFSTFRPLASEWKRIFKYSAICSDC